MNSTQNNMEFLACSSRRNIYGLVDPCSRLSASIPPQILFNLSQTPGTIDPPNAEPM